MPTKKPIDVKLWERWSDRQTMFSPNARDTLRTKQPAWLPRIRSIILDWLFDVCVKFQLLPETYYASLSLFDRHLCSPLTPPIDRDRLQGVAIACLWMCACLYELVPPVVDRLADISDGAADVKGLQRSVVDIIKSLDGDIYMRPNVFTFLRLMTTSTTTSTCPEPIWQRGKRSLTFEQTPLDERAFAFAQCAALLADISLVYSCSLIARACFRLARAKEGEEEEEERKCANQLLFSINNSRSQPIFQAGVFARYPWLVSVASDEELKKLAIDIAPPPPSLSQQPVPPPSNVLIASRKETKTQIVSKQPFSSVYTKGRQIGNGAYGGVCECHSRAIVGLTVAVKKYHDALYTTPGLRELGLMAALKHANVVSALEIFIDAKSVNIVMPLLGGGDLQHYLNAVADGKREMRRCDIQRLMRDVCRGLCYLHRNRVMHRDVKPNNIVIDEDASRAMIIDLSLSRLSSDDGAVENSNNLAKGVEKDDHDDDDDESSSEEKGEKYTCNVCTLPYRAPELILGEKQYDGFALDVWSFGCTLGEMALCTRLLSLDCTEVDQLMRTFALLGTPDELVWPGVSQMPYWRDTFPQWKPFEKRAAEWAHLDASLGASGCDLLKKMLCYDPKRRIRAPVAMKHAFFDEPFADESIVIRPFVETEKEKDKKVVEGL